MERPFFRLGLIFLVALCVRMILLVNVAGHPEVIRQPDSTMYITLAEGLLDNGTLLPQRDPVPVDLVRTPGYPVVLAAILWLCGSSLLAVIFFQVIVDSWSCVLIHTFGDTVLKGTGWLAALLACVNVGMITYSHFLLTDSLFVFFFLVFLIFLFRFLRDGRWGHIPWMGIALGISILMRPVPTLLIFLLAPILFAVLVMRNRNRAAVAGGKVILGGVVLFAMLMPWASWNYIHFGRFQLTAQQGEHLLQYVLPSVRQYSRNQPFLDGMRSSNLELMDRAEREGFDVKRANPFSLSDYQSALALDLLKREPASAVLKAWAMGMAKNLFAPSVVDFSYLLRIERPHFFETGGKTPFEQVTNFILGMKGIFGWALLGNIVVIIFCRCLQAWGLFVLFRGRIWEAVVISAVVAYFLLVSGPIGYAKYRLPFEPVLIVLMAAGLKDLYERWTRRKGHLRFEAVS